MKNYDDIKVFVKCIIAARQITPDKYYEIAQTVQYREEKYFVIIGDDNKLHTMDINFFELK